MILMVLSAAAVFAGLVGTIAEENAETVSVTAVMNLRKRFFMFFVSGFFDLIFIIPSYNLIKKYPLVQQYS